MLELLKEYFRKKDWQYSQLEGRSVFFLGFSLENGKINCVVDIDEANKRFSFYSIHGSNAPEEKRLVIAELLARLNFEVFFGNFEMDYSDGEIRFKTSIEYKSITPTLGLFDSLIHVNVAAMDNALVAISAALFKDMSAKEAYELVAKSKEGTAEAK